MAFDPVRNEVVLFRVLDPAEVSFTFDDAAMFQDLESGRELYVDPDAVRAYKSRCLTCHGATVDESVAATIAELYPEDEAIGFAVGDLRGVFWAEMPE